MLKNKLDGLLETYVAQDGLSYSLIISRNREFLYERCSKDGVPIVLHDKTFERTTNQPGTPSDYTLSEIKEFEASFWQEYGRQAFNPWLDARALDIYQVDLCRNGFTDSLHIGKRIQDIGARMVNHCYKSPISVSACLHWLSVFKEAFIFEDCVEESALRNDLCHERIQATDGFINIPDGPGLGVTLNEDVVQEYIVGETG